VTAGNRHGIPNGTWPPPFQVKQGLPMNMTSVNPVRVYPGNWWEVTGTFTHEPPAGTVTTMLFLSDDASANLYLDTLTLVAAPNRKLLITEILNNPRVSDSMILDEAATLLTNPDTTQREILDLLERAGVGDDEYTITFHLYTANQRILDQFVDYTIDVDGSAVIVVAVEPGTVPTLEELANIGNIYGTVENHGYGFWGWFDNETLDESGRTLDGLRRPVLDAKCVLAHLLGQIDDGTAIFVNGNIDLYGVWIRFGDVDDNGLINMADLHLLQRQINVGHIVNVVLNEIAGNVVVDAVINMADLHLLQRYINFGEIVPVVLGARP